MPKILITNKTQIFSELRKFKRLCDKAGIVKAYRSKEYYEKPTWARQRRKNAAIKRNRMSSRFKLYAPS